MNQPRIAYISFDTVPAPKGAAIHIAAFARSLASAFGGIDLVTVSPTAAATSCQEILPNVFQTALPALGRDLIDRVLYFRTMLGSWWGGKRYDIVQFRSIYEGFPIALNKQRLCHKIVFEVNGLPSIELKYRYPKVAEDRELLYKLRGQEQICLEAADLIVTPSAATRDYLQTRNVPIEKIRVIPNGVDLEVFAYSAQQLKPRNSRPIALETEPFQILYFGTLSIWQGVRVAVEAIALANRDFPAHLTAIGPGRSQQVADLQEQARKLGVLENLRILPPVSQKELVRQIHQADAIVAPLTPNDRNLVQGCCPLKVLEAMAAGTPAIASDLPAVAELGIDLTHFILVKPRSAKAIKDAMLLLRDSPELSATLAANARKRIEQYYTWEQAGAALVDAYSQLLLGTGS